MVLNVTTLRLAPKDGVLPPTFATLPTTQAGWNNFKQYFDFNSIKWSTNETKGGNITMVVTLDGQEGQGLREQVPRLVQQSKWALFGWGSGMDTVVGILSGEPSAPILRDTRTLLWMKGKPLWTQIQLLLLQESFVQAAVLADYGNSRVSTGRRAVGRGVGEQTRYTETLPTIDDFKKSSNLITNLYSVYKVTSGAYHFEYKYDDHIGQMSMSPFLHRADKNERVQGLMQTMAIGPHYVAVYVVKTHHKEMKIEEIMASAKVTRIAFSMIEASISRFASPSEKTSAANSANRRATLAAIKARAQEGNYLIDDKLANEFAAKIDKIKKPGARRNTAAIYNVVEVYNRRMLASFDTNQPLSTSLTNNQSSASSSKQTLNDYFKSA